MAIGGLVAQVTFQLMIRARTSSLQKETDCDVRSGAKLKGLLTEVECLESLKSMESNKNP